MKKRHIRIAKKLCEAYQREMHQRPGIRHPPWTAWNDVHIGWKRLFYKWAMEGRRPNE